MKRIQILLVEDDPYLGLIVNDLFESRGYKVFYEKSGESGYKTFEKEVPDLCVLDVVLPGIDGFNLGRKIRSKNPSVPIIYLTALTQKDDLIQGYASGADDYIRKPFHMEELILRVETLLKRYGKISATDRNRHLFEFLDYRFDPFTMTLESPSGSVLLTPKETGILEILLNHLGELVDREFILKEVWGNDSYFNIKSMDVFMHKLRSRFSQDKRIRIINVRGRGFRMISL